MSINVNALKFPLIGIDRDDKAVIILSAESAIQLPLKWDADSSLWVKLNDDFVYYGLYTFSFRELPAPLYISNRMFSNIKIGRFGNVGGMCIVFYSEKRTIGVSLLSESDRDCQSFSFDVGPDFVFYETPEVWAITCRSL